METSPDPYRDVPELAKNDPMGPPPEPCLCYCLHCQRQVMSDQMWFQIETKNGKPVGGFWMCPTSNCDGAGFEFDIYPVDPDHPANAGWVFFDDDEEFDEDGTPVDGIDTDNKYDPAEPHYAAMEAEEDDDLEGEEWKHGLQPGERPPESESMAAARREYEAEQKMYDAPDERPRSYERTRNDDDDFKGSQNIGSDDIPF